MENRVEPRTLAGFMELLPEKQIEFNRMKDIIRKNYEKYTKIHRFVIMHKKSF